MADYETAGDTSKTVMLADRCGCGVAMLCANFVLAHSSNEGLCVDANGMRAAN